MITTLVLVTIGLAIVSATISGAKRTEVRETDISITYDGLKIIDQMTADLSLESKTFSLVNLSGSLLDSNLSSIITGSILSKYKSLDSVSCVNVIDVSQDAPTYYATGDENKCLGDKLSTLETFSINTTDYLTRVLELVVVTETPDREEGFVKRTARKRVILSPLPSFLKYAVGSAGTLRLNGSPNIEGNLFANSIAIQKEAEYVLTNNTTKDVDTPFPSIHGDLYTNSKESTYSEFSSILTPNHFYKGKIPPLKNDSQFVNIDLGQTILQQTDVLLPAGLISTNNPQDLVSTITSTYSLDSVTSVPSDVSVFEDGILKDITDSLSGLLGGALSDLLAGGKDVIFQIDKNLTSPVSVLTIPGDLVVNGNIEALNLPELIIDGDLYIIGNAPVNLKNIVTTGNVYIYNESASSIIDGDIISAGSIVLEGHKDFSITGNIFSQDDLTIKVFDSVTSITGNIVSKGNLVIQGNNNEISQNGSEDDNVAFDAVMYVGGSAIVSNLNILPVGNSGDKQLILLSQGDLTITRMNEFSNFADSDEKGNLPNDASIKPLKAFFYTDGVAELYGVGSLFYIDGGVFSKDDLIINSIRGDISSIDHANTTVTGASQIDHYSRFNVDYNRDVLLQKIDFLPQVENLTLFSDSVVVD